MAANAACNCQHDSFLPNLLLEPKWVLLLFIVAVITAAREQW